MSTLHQTGSFRESEAASQRRKRRRPWLAALLAMVCPGLGHLYVGRPWLAVAVAFAGPAALMIGPVWGAYRPRALGRLVFVALAVYVAFWISQTLGAVLLANRQGNRYVLRPWNRLIFYVGFLVGTTVVLDISRQWIRQNVIEPFRIPSGAMTPTLPPGDQIFAVKVGEARNTLRGDVIVFTNPVNVNATFIKRVVGVPGDRIKLVHHLVYVNGEAQPRRLLEPRYAYLEQRGDREETAEALLYEESFGGRSHRLIERPSTCRDPRADICTYDGGREFTVPDGQFFVLGDNRDNSADSRFGFGAVERGLVFVPAANIKGKAALIWLSFSGNWDIRWERIGLLLF